MWVDVQCTTVDRLPTVSVKSPSSIIHRPFEFTKARSDAGKEKWTVWVSPGIRVSLEKPRRRLLSGMIDAT